MTENERIAILETKVSQIQQDVGAVKDAQEEVLDRVNKMHDVFMQAKGARWAFIAMAALGGFISAKIVPILQALGIVKP